MLDSCNKVVVVQLHCVVVCQQYNYRKRAIRRREFMGDRGVVNATALAQRTLLECRSRKRPPIMPRNYIN